MVHKGVCVYLLRDISIEFWPTGDDCIGGTVVGLFPHLGEVGFKSSQWRIKQFSIFWRKSRFPQNDEIEKVWTCTTVQRNAVFNTVKVESSPNVRTEFNSEIGEFILRELVGELSKCPKFSLRLIPLKKGSHASIQTIQIHIFSQSLEKDNNKVACNDGQNRFLWTMKIILLRRLEMSPGGHRPPF